MRFLTYIKSSDVLKIIMKKYEEGIRQFQQGVFERFNQRKQLTQENTAPKKMTVQDYFSSGDACGRDNAWLEEITHCLDYYYFMLERLCYFGNYSQLTQNQINQLTTSKQLLNQVFDFSERPQPLKSVGHFDTLYSASGSWGHNLPYMHESLDKFGGVFYGEPNAKKMLLTSLLAYST